MSKTVVLFPEGAFGPTNNCVGIGEQLKARGHRVVFIIEESFEGTLATRGFEEALMRLGPRPEVEEAPGQFWKDFIRETAPVFRKPTIEQLGEFIQPTWQALLDGSRYVEPRLREIFAELRPDVIVEDNVPAFPAVVTADAPWVRIVSCNPLELKDAELPPVFSGYPVADRSGWGEFGAEYDRTHREMWASFDDWVQEQGAPPLADLEFIHTADLNMYLYPQEADYRRSRPPAGDWHRLDSCVRSGDGDFEIPESLRDGPGGLIYLSLGSLASADVALMERLVEVLGRTSHRFIVSKGPQADLYELADNMWGEEFLPQPAVLPQVDLVITHGGNNTTTECFHHGKPMIAMPVFWDQYDNAQRVDEAGFGVRLDTYGFTDGEMTAALDRLLADTALHERMADISRRLQADPGAVRAADLIERL
ncbi:MAG TPA: nucleotide disphospho-sugar-binding domain-containing protein [Gaiellales bacterium]|nr:nucleotide disphospho-sugar-binding domain-containing protein [Gaiellales bacterium]